MMKIVTHRTGIVARIRYAVLLLSILCVFTCPQKEHKAVTVTVDPSVSYQMIEGWGGHLYPQAYPFFESDSTFVSMFLDSLKTTHIRVRSFWYMLEGRNDNPDPEVIDWQRIASGDTGLVHDELLMQQQLYSRNIKLMFAAWRYPYWMAGKSPDWRPGFDDKPELPEHMEKEFIEGIVAYLLYAKEAYGIHFDAVSIANEPDIGIYITGLNPARLLKLTIELKKTLDGHDYKTQYYPPEVAAADSISREYAEKYFKLDGVAEMTAAVSYHSYRRDISTIRFYAELGKAHNLPIWVTEQNHTHLALPDRHEWSHALKNAECLHDILTVGHASLSVHFCYAMSGSGGLSIYLPERKAWAPTYDMLKHFYNHVPPGAVRIAAEPAMVDTTVRSLAFLSHDEVHITLHLINSDVKARRIKLKSAVDVREKTDIIQSTAGALYRMQTGSYGKIITLPPESVTTLLLRREIK